MAGRAVKALAVAAVLAIVLVPFLSVVATSFASEQEIAKHGGLLLWPVAPSLDAYREMLASGVVMRAMVVSLGVTIVGTAVSVAATVGLAYALSRPIVGGRAMLLLCLFTMLFVPGIIPSYLTVRSLGLLDNYAALVLPVMVNAFNLVVMRQFFMGLPQELTDAARIDGASDFRILLQIVLPLSKAAVAVITLFYAVAYWNAFFNALIYLNDTARWPLQLIVRQYVIQGAPLADPAGGIAPPTRAVQMAVVVTAMLPIVLTYPLLQRYFTRGVLSGAIKM